MAWVSCQDCYHYCKWYIIIHKTNKPLLTQKEGNDDSQYNKDPYKDKGKCRGSCYSMDLCYRQTKVVMEDTYGLEDAKIR